MQRRCGHHDGKDRPRRIRQCAKTDCRNGKAGDQSLGAGRIDDGASRHLADQTDYAPDRQHQTDLGLGPLLGREVNRDERSESGLHICQKEDEPVEAARALARGSCRRFDHHQLSYPRRTTIAAVARPVFLSSIRSIESDELANSMITRCSIDQTAVASDCRLRQAPRWADPPCIRAPPLPDPWSIRA